MRVIGAGKSWRTTTELRDSKLGPQVGKQLLGERLDSRLSGILDPGQCESPLDGARGTTRSQSIPFDDCAHGGRAE